MELIRILEALERYSEETVAYKLDATFAHAVTEASTMLQGIGEQLTDAQLRLEEYEKLKDAGKLFVSPLKPGDVVYITGHKFASEIELVNLEKEGLRYEYVEYDRSPELTEVWDDGEFYLADIGITVFLTPEECRKAEEKMEE